MKKLCTLFRMSKINYFKYTYKLYQSIFVFHFLITYGINRVIFYIL